MKNQREYEIAFVGLKPGIHEFSYEIKDKFFDAFQKQDFTNCNAHVKLTLDKHQSFLQLKFEIGGKVDIGCDRCGSDLPLELWDDFVMVVKLVENPEEMNMQEEDPDIFYISRTESHLNVQDWIYEFINLSIPLQRMCKEEEIGGKYCNMEVLEKLKKMDDESQNDQNPIWKGLDKFKNK